MIGVITLPVRVHGADVPMHAYVLHSKGPALIMGVTFLEDNKLLVDCASRTLTMQDGGGQVKCLSVQAGSSSSVLHLVDVPSCQPARIQSDVLMVQRFPVDGCLPP